MKHIASDTILFVGTMGVVLFLKRLRPVIIYTVTNVEKVYRNKRWRNT